MTMLASSSIFLASSSRLAGESILESFTPSLRNSFSFSWGMATPAITMGPRMQPLPASSIPEMIISWGASFGGIRRIFFWKNKRLHVLEQCLGYTLGNIHSKKDGIRGVDCIGYYNVIKNIFCLKIVFFLLNIL